MNAETMMSAHEMSDQLAITPATLKSWIKKGIIDRTCYIKVGNVYRFYPTKTLHALHKHTGVEQAKDQETGQMTEQLELPLTTATE